MNVVSAWTPAHLDGCSVWSGRIRTMIITVLPEMPLQKLDECCIKKACYLRKLGFSGTLQLFVPLVRLSVA